MFARNVIDYAHPRVIELAWADPDVRAFWLAEAEAIINDLHQPLAHRYRRATAWGEE